MIFEIHQIKKFFFYFSLKPLFLHMWRILSFSKHMNGFPWGFIGLIDFLLVISNSFLDSVFWSYTQSQHQILQGNRVHYIAPLYHSYWPVPVCCFRHAFEAVLRVPGLWGCGGGLGGYGVGVAGRLADLGARGCLLVPRPHIAFQRIPRMQGQFELSLC